MKKRILLSLLAFFLLIGLKNAEAQTVVNKEWETFNGIPDSIAYSSSTLDGQGNLIVTSNAITAGQQANLLVMKYDRNGNLLWQDNYNGAFNGKDYGIAVTTDNANNIYVAGASQTGAISSDYIIRKYNSTGTLQWSSNYSGSGTYNAPTAIAVDNSGNVYVTGLTFSLSTQTDYATLKYNSSGVQQWVQTYNYANLYDVPAGIEVNPTTGKVYVTGASASTNNNYDYATVEYEATSGNQLNVSRVTAPGTGFDKATAIERDNAGNIYITGQAFEQTTNSYDIKTIKLNASLAVQWIQTYDQVGLEDLATTIGIDNTGNVVVGGYVSTTDEGRNCITLKYDSNGNLLWEREYNNPEQNRDEEIRKLAIDNNRGITVVGTTDHGNVINSLIMKYDEDGDIMRLKMGEQQGNEKPSDIKIDDGGNVYVSGTSFDGNSDKNIVIKYTNYELPFIVDYNLNGNPTHLKNQIIVRFYKSAINSTLIDRPEIEYAAPSKFLTPTAYAQLSSVLPFVLDRQYFVKIFRGLTTNDSVSITRTGQSIKIPDFWASFILTLPPNTDEQTICNLLNSQSTLVKYAHLNATFELNWSPIDNFYGRQASLHPATPYSVTYNNGHINTESAWDLTQGEEYIKVGIFDSNVDWQHPDFGYDPANGLDTPLVKLKGWDFSLNMNLYNAPRGNSTHGTNVAGIVGAWNNNNFGTSPFGGVAGIAGGDATTGNRGASLYSMAILPDGFLVSTISLATAAMIQGAVETPGSNYGYGLHIFNNSWGREDYNWNSDSLALFKDAVHHVNRNGVVFCASRGNEGIDNPNIPAILDDDWVLILSGTTSQGAFHPSSSYGHGVDIAAPYSSLIVYTTDFFNGNIPDTLSYTWFSGTSAACPHAAGTAALMLSYANQPNPDYNNLVHEDVEYILQRTADDDLTNPGYDDFMGYGKLNAGNALHLIEKPFRYVRHFDSEVFPSVKNFTFEGTTNIHLTEMADNPTTGGVFLSGNYQADVHKITATVTHNLAANENIYLDYYWTRPSASTTVGEVDNTTNPADVSPHEKAYITNINNNTAEVVGYAYQIYVGGNPIGWLPYDPNTQLDSFKLAYSILVEDLTAVGLPPRNTENAAMRLYPNPTTESHTLDISATQADNVRVTCYNSQGQNIGVVYEGQVHTGNNSIILSVKNLTQGFYFYRIETSQGVSNQKFVKK